MNLDPTTDDTFDARHDPYPPPPPPPALVCSSDYPRPGGGTTSLTQPATLLTAVDDEGSSLLVPLESHRSLVSRWRDAKSRAADATAEANELRDEILATLTTDRTAELLAARNLESITATLDGVPAARVRYVRTRRFDKRSAEAEDPDLIARHTRLSDPEPRLEVAE